MPIKWGVFAPETPHIMTCEVEADTMEMEDARRIAIARGSIAEDIPIVVVGLSIASGDQKKVGDMCVAELAQIFGIGDVYAVRELRSKEREALGHVHEMLANVTAIKAVRVEKKIQTPDDVDRFAAEVKATFAAHPGSSLLLVMAWVDSGGIVSTRPGSPPTSKLN